MDYDLNTLADTYLRNQATKREEDFWAWEEVFRLVRSGDVNSAWQITFLLLKKAESDEALGYVAAGPLEDLVDGYGDQALDRIEEACEQDSKLQFALSGIWLMPDSPVLGRWRGLMDRYGFRSGTLSHCHTTQTVSRSPLHKRSGGARL